MKKTTIDSIKDLKTIVLDNKQQTKLKAGGGGALSGARVPSN